MRIASHFSSRLGSRWGRFAFIGKSVFGRFSVDFRSSGTPGFSPLGPAQNEVGCTGYPFIIGSAQTSVQQELAARVSLYFRDTPPVILNRLTTVRLAAHPNIKRSK